MTSRTGSHSSLNTLEAAAIPAKQHINHVSWK
jgi:hypothetical protein